MVAKTEAAYFKKINDEGGINGRKIVFLSYDDGYSPPKTVEQTRRLVESDEVFLVFNAMGTATNSAVQKYLNGKRGTSALCLQRSCKNGTTPKSFRGRLALHLDDRFRETGLDEAGIHGTGIMLVDSSFGKI
jgi:branched-chain amino acid transport system substrate-binding protein